MHSASIMARPVKPTWFAAVAKDPCLNRLAAGRATLGECVLAAARGRPGYLQLLRQWRAAGWDRRQLHVMQVGGRVRGARLLAAGRRAVLLRNSRSQTRRVWQQLQAGAPRRSGRAHSLQCNSPPLQLPPLHHHSTLSRRDPKPPTPVQGTANPAPTTPIHPNPPVASPAV